MPYSVLLEVALQPCGWLAAYMGSALKSDKDLFFRNLQGQGQYLRPVTPASGVLEIDVAIEKVSQSAGMIIQEYRFAVRDSLGTVFEGYRLWVFH